VQRLGTHAQDRLVAVRRGARRPRAQQRAARRAQAAALGVARAAQHVVVADEAGDEGVGRRLVQLLGARDLLDAAVVEERDAIRERARLRLVVRDEHHGHAELAMQAADLELHLLAQLLVERRERLVHQHHARLEHERARERDPLLLAARELLGLAPGELAQPDLVESGRDLLARLRGAGLAHAERERHVLLDGHVREERIALEHHAHVAAMRGQRLDRPAVEPDRAGARRSRSRRAASASSSCPSPKGRAG
jgi:hypothetical protein